MTTALRGVLGLVLRVFFRRVELSGAERVPSRGPVVFVLNHPNGLIDPAVVLCLAPRRTAFLAKATLFRMPVIGWLARRFDAIPVHRPQDPGTDPARNRETFEAARVVLAGGGAIAIFPEGASHSDPRLRRLKTGAARIALGAAARLDPRAPLRIVPAGLYYRAKGTFRSAALLHFGEPYAVEPVALAPGEEPPAPEVLALTGRIEQALAGLTLQAERAEVHGLVAAVERLIAVTEEPPREAVTLADEFTVRRRILAGYATAEGRWPDRVARLVTRLQAHVTACRAFGLDPRHLVPESFTWGRVARYAVPRLTGFALLAPVALVGLVLHYPAYRAVGFIATGMARGSEDALATVKVLGAALLFPLTWAAAAAAAGIVGGVRWAGLTAFAVPLTGYAALVCFERLDRFVARARALGLFLARRRAFLRLAAEGRAIRREIMQLGREVDAAAATA